MQVIRLDPLRKQLFKLWVEALPNGKITIFGGELMTTERADIIREMMRVVENQEKIEVNELGCEK